MALMEKAVGERSKIRRPESADEGFSSVMDRKGTDHSDIETSDERNVEPPLSVGCWILALTHVASTWVWVST